MVYRGPETRPYHLLDGVIPLDDDGELFDRLLGLVTEDLARPLSSYRPEAPFKAKDHIQKPNHLYPKKAVECEDVEWLQENTVEKEAKLEFTRLLKLWGSHTEKKANTWGSTLLRRIEIQENPRQRIKELLSVPEYERGVRELIHGHSGTGKQRQLAIITGFITCADMTVNKDDEKAIAGGASLEPVTEPTTGVPGAAMAAKGSLRKTRHQTISGAYKGEVVVACYYLPIVGEVIEPVTQSFSIFGLSWPLNQLQSSRLQLSEEPMVVHSADDRAAYEIKRKAIRGNMDRPLGASVELLSDVETSDGTESIVNEEDLIALGFTIGLAGCVDEDDSE
ncbi:hypothetical protein CEP52_016787 [Fusarium oligoseptatum]|uniref:Uncharacterized protein n=2 Tax=Fusarium solani species complex TaxID=232080 RepID=A0A428S0F2_9HYPO|nr:hypothetical protein CEP51_016121 [Fusarium floridanum]RSL83173.1 hypothetical protein CEP52_016787 [Fusarium oligoseptatum]